MNISPASSYWLQESLFSALLYTLRVAAWLLRRVSRAPRQVRPPAPPLPPRQSPPLPRLCTGLSSTEAARLLTGANGTVLDPRSASEWCRSVCTAPPSQTGPRLAPGGFKLPPIGGGTVTTTAHGPTGSSTE